ncbi:MAG: HAMP domain-containing histidine kinase [Pirellulales bacterium]|nr:HAMP domain-containing histidine kinase [Pirellulales bacterium]
MRRNWMVWLLFALSLAVVLAATVWISRTMLKLDRAEADARRRAALEENVRLALWRMDTALAPLVGQESARPYFVYRPLLSTDSAYGWMIHDSPHGAVFPSPLLKPVSPYILLHFQFLPDGRIISPQAPTASDLAMIKSRYVSESAIDRAAARLATLRTRLRREELFSQLPEPGRAAGEMTAAAQHGAAPRGPAQRITAADGRQDRGAVEFLRRDQAIVSNAAAMARQQMTLPPVSSGPVRADFGSEVMTPLWIGGELILARRVSVGGEEYLQGCLLDWQGIRTWLLDQIGDLAPGADLKPVPADDVADGSRRLAALPIRLAVPAPAATTDGKFSPLGLSLVAAWRCLILAAAASGLLLWGVMRLSQRRATFVSAVTHELRTPLTTFHMYTEMLAEGMVKDPEQQREYLQTFRGEAARLTHLVENVLAYARLERGRKAAPVESLCLGELLQGFFGRLDARARQSDRELVLEKGPRVEEAVVRVDSSAVEQILLNLVDNACKHARASTDRRIHLSARQQGRQVEIRILDHGPGLPSPVRRRLFRPFRKSASEAACSAPGVGLGLALSRRLARDMGGRLELDRGVSEGACFVLTVPVVKTSRQVYSPNLERRSSRSV